MAFADGQEIGTDELVKGMVISCYYWDKKANCPVPRKGVVDSVHYVDKNGMPFERGPHVVVKTDARGYRSLKFADIQGTLRVHGFAVE